MNQVELEDMVRIHRRSLTLSAYDITRNWADAEDAVQNALIVAWEKRDQFNPDMQTPFVGWVRGIVRRNALNVRAVAVRYVPVGGWEDECGFEFVDEPKRSNGLPCMADPGVAERVEKALATLTPYSRQVVRMYCLEGMTRRQIADKLGKKPTTIHQAITNAFKDAHWDGPEWRATRGAECREARLFRDKRWLLKLLANRERQAVELRYIAGLSAADTAARLGTTEKAVHVAVYKARRTLNEHIRELVSA